MTKTTHPRSLRSIENTGFSTNSAVEGTRLINRNGYPNLRKTGIPFYERISIYHSLLRMPRAKFLLLVFAFYTTVNLLFAVIYFIVGTEHFTTSSATETAFQKFSEAFFFSAQTLTTVGYGHIAPVGILMNSIASLESLLGIMAFALVTGVFYGRFARPRAYLLFSHNFLVAPYNGGRALMMRLVTYKNTNLTDVEATVTAALHVADGAQRATRFFPLKLEIAKVNALALSWTVVHPIDEESPVYGFSEQDFAANRIEVIINLKAFDDHFSNIVQQRTSYTYNELVFGAKFLPMYERPEGSSHTTLELDKINLFEWVALPEEGETPAQDAPDFVAAKI